MLLPADLLRGLLDNNIITRIGIVPVFLLCKRESMNFSNGTICYLSPRQGEAGEHLCPNIPLKGSGGILNSARFLAVVPQPDFSSPTSVASPVCGF